jgi:hypothetical protein
MHSADTGKLFWILPGRLRSVTELLNHLEFGWVPFPTSLMFRFEKLALRQRRATGVLVTLLRNGLNLDPAPDAAWRSQT